MKLSRVKVFSHQLKVGMFVSELDKPWEESDFLLQGFMVQDDDDIEQVKRQCQYVYVEFKDESEYNQFRKEATVSKTLKEQYEQDALEDEIAPRSIHHEINTANKLNHKGRKLVKGLLDKIMLGEDFEISTVRSIVKDYVKSIMRNENAILLMTLIKNKDDYTAEHCLNVGIMSMAFARFLGAEPDEIEEIGLCGMLHDIGKVKVDSNILDKPGKLTPDEYTEMKMHAEYGKDVLLKKRETSPLAIDVAYTHHERLNGEGYPRGLSGDQISHVSRLIAIVDVFDAITSARCYEEARPILDAYTVLMKGREIHFDAHLVTKFIEWRGIYPPGSIVEMENGEVGIVLATNPRYKLRPKVLLILDEDKKPRAKERVIDMSKIDLDSSGKAYRITKAVANHAYGVELQDYVNKGLKIESF